MKVSPPFLPRGLFAGLWLLLAATTGAFWVPPGERLPNFDQRAAVSPEKWSADHAAAVSRLRALVSDARVDFDERIGTVKWVASTRGFLSGPLAQGRGISSRTLVAFAPGEAYLPSKAFLREHSALFGHGPELLEKARVKRAFITPHNGLKTVVWEQTVEGIAVFEGLLISHTTAKGELVSVSSHFLPNPVEAAQAGVAGRALVQTNPPIVAKAAVASAARNIGVALDATGVIATGLPAPEAELRQRFQADGLNGNAEARLVWLPMSRLVMRLCWEVILTSRARGEMYRVLIDAQAGEALLRHCLTEYFSDASYRVFAGDSPSPFSPGCDSPCDTQPPVVARTLVTLGALDTNASPSGWMDDGVNETLGNNVSAHTDRDFDDEPDLPRPQGSPARVFDFELNLAQAPTNYASAGVTELFYWCNWMHDRLYALGFTEAAGNFQTTNFGRGGFDGDAVQADAQDGAGFNNANMATPPDGWPGRLQMFLFNGPTPDRDGDLDHEVVLHELTHGLSNRRVGGGVGLSAPQSRGLGEGWSDWFALALLSEPGDDLNSGYASGAYVAHQLGGLAQNYYFGVRRYPYSTDRAKNPLTFKDIDPEQADGHPGVPRSPIIGSAPEEVHNQGEVWGVTLWDARARLIAKHGYANGNQLILQLVTDGMNLTPANPNFLQARDGILQADLIGNGGGNLAELWAAFAGRGMGASAVAPLSSTTLGVIEAFDLPDGLLVTPAAGFTSTGPVGGTFYPAVKNFTLVNIGTDTLNWAASATALWLDLSATSGALAVGESNTVTAMLNPLANGLAAGNYTNVVSLTNVASGAVQSRTFILRVGQPDYFSELFDGGDNDLANQTLTFTPDGSANFYSVCREPAFVFPTDPADGLPLPLGAHTYLPLVTAQNVSIYGRSTNLIYLASEGHVTMVSPDASGLISLANHFSRPRVSASLAHIHPTENGGRVLTQHLPDRVAITFDRVLEWGTDSTNTFQIELFYDGRIRMTHLAQGSAGGLVGLSRGTGTPAGFVESDLTGYRPCALPLAVTVTPKATEGDGVLPRQGQVNISFVAATNVTVNLVSADTSEVTVPPAVTIPPGQTTVTFDLTIVDDPELDGVQRVVITASAPGRPEATDVIQIADDEGAALSLIVPNSVIEGGVPVQGILLASAAPTVNFTVSLSSSDPTEIQVPSSVTLPAGQTSVVFQVSMPDDVQIDGLQVASVTAHVSNWSDAVTQITVHDNETTNLMVTLPSAVREGDGLLAEAANVRISGTLTTNLLVNLWSAAPMEIMLPGIVTIPAGETNVTVGLIIVDDADMDGPQTVSITASAVGFGDGLATMTVNDNESPPVPAKPSPAHLATNVLQATDLAWQSGALPGEVTTNEIYFGTNPAPGPAEFQGSTTNTSWTLPNLLPQTTYYWQVVARKAGVVPGPVWQFTTRGVDHFVWDAVLSPQAVGKPFGVTITARDALETTVSNFSGTLNLDGSVSGAQRTNVILGNLVHNFGSDGNWTLGYSFTPNTNLTVTHVRSYSGAKVSLWTDTGILLASTNVSGVAGTWTETALARPVMLSAGNTYRIGFFTGGADFYWRSDGDGGFADGVIHQGFEISGDGFPSVSDGVRWWFVDMRYTVGPAIPWLVQPTVSGTFTEGVWIGEVTAFAPATNLVLRADDGSGHTGTSNPFSVSLRNDISVSVTGTPDPVSLGGNVTYTITITNIGPSAAVKVLVTNKLTAAATFVSVTPSQGTAANYGDEVVCQLHTLPANAAATVFIVATANSLGNLTNQTFVTRSDADAYSANNFAVLVTAVQAPVIAINDTSRFEGNAASADLVFTVSLSVPALTNVAVSFATTNGTAEAGGDYFATNGVLNFAPGQVSQMFAVQIVGDAILEPNETFLVVLGNPVNAAISDAVGVGTILKDENTGFVAYYTDHAAAATGWEAPITQAGLMPVRVASIATLALGNVDLLVIDEEQNGAMSGALLARLPEIETWVNDGGKLIVHDRSAGNFQPNPFLLGMADVSTVRLITPDLDVIPPGTNGVVAGPHGAISDATLDGGISSAHGHVPREQLPAGAEPILSSGGDPTNVACFAYPRGNGMIYYSAIPLDCYLSGGECSDNPISAALQTIYAPNVLAYVLGKTGGGGFAPVIVSPPADLTAIAGSSASLEVTAAGIPPPAYQWRKGGLAIAGATNALHLILSVQAADAGDYTVVVRNAFGAVTSSVVVVTVVDLPVNTEFRILTLTANNSRVVDHAALTGDDRGGIAISAGRVFYTGDNSTARFAVTDLSGGIALGQVFDALVSDLRSGRVYSLGNGTGPLTYSGGTVTALLEHDILTGDLTGAAVNLSEPINLPTNFGNVGIFAGFGRVVLHSGSRVYDIAMASGLVTDLGAMESLPHQASENWAYWGAAEHFDGAVHLVCVRDFQTISRTRVPDGATTNLATFDSLSDMAAFTVSVPNHRWYFHHEYGSQFGGTLETIGYADATFSVVGISNPPAILAQPASQSVLLGDSAAFAVSVTGDAPLVYQWRKDAMGIVGATNSSYVIGNVQSNHVGVYSVVVSNLYGYVLSSNAWLALAEAASPLRFLTPQIAGDDLQLALGTLNGSPITAVRAAGIQLYSSTNLSLDPGHWRPVNVSTLLTNGVLEIRGLSHTNVPFRFFRAEETP